MADDYYRAGQDKTRQDKTRQDDYYRGAAPRVPVTATEHQMRKREQKRFIALHSKQPRAATAPVLRHQLDTGATVLQTPWFFNFLYVCPEPVLTI